MRIRALLLVLPIAWILSVLWVQVLWVQGAYAADALPDFLLCQQATAAAEHATGVPDQLLDAISRVESGRPGPDGMLHAWPWTINFEGQGHYYSSKAEAILAARRFIQNGNRSIDLGCTQINQLYHPQAFASFEDAFDPARNAAYAARFLTDLFHQTGSWPHAAAAYHSQTPELGTDYQRKVLQAWADPVVPANALSDGLPPRAPRRTRPEASAPVAATGAIWRPFGHQASASMPPHAFAAMPRPGLSQTPRAARPSIGVSSGRDLWSYRSRPVAMLAMMQRSPRD